MSAYEHGKQLNIYYLQQAARAPFYATTNGKIQEPAPMDDHSHGDHATGDRHKLLDEFCQ